MGDPFQKIMQTILKPKLRRLNFSPVGVWKPNPRQEEMSTIGFKKVSLVAECMTLESGASFR